MPCRERTTNKRLTHLLRARESRGGILLDTGPDALDWQGLYSARGREAVPWRKCKNEVVFFSDNTDICVWV